MSVYVLLTLVGFAWLLIGRVASYNLTMSPDHVTVSEAFHTATYTCSAGVALTGCQFTWRDREGKEGPLLDLSRGSLSQANSTHLTSELTGYSYSGRGLEAGYCGVTLKVTGWKSWMVACRVRAGNGGWSYAWADLFAHNYVTISHTRTPREAVVLRGGEARFALKAEGPLNQCIFYLPDKTTLHFNQGSKSAHSADRHRYLGAGLQSGECGLAVSNVREEDNGPVEGWIHAFASDNDYRYMTLIVASLLCAPTLSVVYTEASVTATCEVNRARPVAQISWILGNEIIRQDSLEDSLGNPEDEWRWPWMKGSVMQRLTLTLQTKDNGKVLKCVVSHVTLARPFEATETISFTEAVSATTPLAVSSATPGAALNTTCDPSTALDPSCTAASMLGRVCQENKGLHNASCPRDEVYELRVREAAARTAELAEEHANVTLEAAKVTLETVKVTLEAAKAYSASNASLAKVTLETAKVTLDAARSSARSRAQKEASDVTAAQLGVEGARDRAKADEAWRINAQEELEFERARRSESLLQLQRAQG